MRVATYAKGGGRAVAFSLAAFRQVFAGGRDLGDEGTVLIAAAACEMHPSAVLKGVSLRSVGASLAARGRARAAAGVTAAARDRRSGPTCSAARRARAGDWRRCLRLVATREADEPRPMKANRVFHLIVTRGGREPAFMADRRRIDRIEVVSIDDGELLLYWELPAKDAAKLLAPAARRPGRAGGRGVPGPVGGRRRQRPDALEHPRRYVGPTVDGLQHTAARPSPPRRRSRARRPSRSPTAPAARSRGAAPRSGPPSRTSSCPSRPTPGALLARAEAEGATTTALLVARLRRRPARVPARQRRLPRRPLRALLPRQRRRGDPDPPRAPVDRDGARRRHQVRRPSSTPSWRGWPRGPAPAS